MLNFNPSGHLVPNQPIISTLEELHSEFVVDYTSVERSTLYDSYSRYSADLKAVCGGVELRQWINGSFATRSEPRPSDIDMVTFLDAELVKELGSALDRFKYPDSKLNYPGIDGYIVSVYAEGSPHYFTYRSDELHWQDEFDKTRRNRAGRKLPKGFLEIKY